MQWEQSHTQCIIDISYRFVLPILAWQIFYLVVFQNSVSVETYVVLPFFVLCAVFLYVLWLKLFNTGPNRVKTLCVAVDKTEITVASYGKSERVAKTDFAGVTQSGRFPRKIVLQRLNAKPITFSYYALNRSQRETLFEALTTWTD